MKAWVVFLPAVEPATERRSSSAVSLPNDYVRSDGRTHGEHMVAEAERKKVGEMRGLEGGAEVRRPIFHTAERIHVVPPKGIVELEEGYVLPRGGIKERPSFLVEVGLDKKLVPVEAA
jgi:hypothetical protein